MVNGDFVQNDYFMIKGDNADWRTLYIDLYSSRFSVLINVRQP